MLCVDNTVYHRSFMVNSQSHKEVCSASFVCEILECYSPSVTACCTGYPVLRNKVDFKRTDKAANKEDLNRVVTATKVTESRVQMCSVFIRTLIKKFLQQPL